MRVFAAAAWTLVVASAGACYLAADDVGAPAIDSGMATPDRVADEPGFWPTRGTAARSDYVGTAVCLRCHKRDAGQVKAEMARASMRPQDSPAFLLHPELKFRRGDYAYSIKTAAGKAVYSVTDGKRSLSAPLGWAFGDGSVGQSFLFERDGHLYESRMTYFDSIGGLDFTPDQAVSAPKEVEDAMARPVDSVEAPKCFACHATAAATSGKLDLEGMTLGVTCEACHGPGRVHVAREEGGSRDMKDTIVNPRRFEPHKAVDFCGACHTTRWDIILMGDTTGTFAMRSQPFRLQSSKCWQSADARLTCFACHDPHQPLVHASASYDGRCLACHVGKGGTPTAQRPGHGCKVRNDNCVQCHMPKYAVDGMHAEFTDHWIRVVKTESGTK